MDPRAPVPPFQFALRRMPSHLAVTVSGHSSLDDFVGLIDAMAFETRQHRDRRALVDLRQVDNELKFTDHFQIGDHVARKLQNLDRLASVVPADKITRTSEKVAAHQGLELRVFTSVEDALAWIMEPAEGDGLADLKA